MTAALRLITTDLAEALAKFTREPVVGDVCPEHLWRLQILVGDDVTLATPVSAVRAKLLRLIEREHGKRESRHWSFDMNRLIAMQLFASLFERTEGN